MMKGGGSKVEEMRCEFECCANLTDNIARQSWTSQQKEPLSYSCLAVRQL